MLNRYQELQPGAKLDNYETPKAYILMIAKAIDGRYGDPDACLRTVRQYWKNTAAGLDRDGHIWSARTYCARLHDAGIRAGFPSLSNHNFRVEGLRAVGKRSWSLYPRFPFFELRTDEEYTSSQRSRHFGHEAAPCTISTTLRGTQALMVKLFTLAILLGPSPPISFASSK